MKEFLTVRAALVAETLEEKKLASGARGDKNTGWVAGWWKGNADCLESTCAVCHDDGANHTGAHVALLAWGNETRGGHCCR